MKKRILVIGFILAASMSFSQALIDTLAIQDFEINPQSPTWSFTGPVVYNSGFTGSNAAPPNSPIGVGGSRAWETTTNSSGLALTFDNVIIPPGYDSIRLNFALAAMNLLGTTGGPDNLEWVVVEYSTNNGVSYVSRLRIQGAVANNSFWPYTATGHAKVFYLPASVTMFQPQTSGLQTTMGFSNCEIVFPGNISQLRVRITARSSSSTDTWLIDNVRLTGEIDCFAQTNQSFTECQGFSVNVNGNTYSQTGIYRDTLVSSQNCDSVIVTNLTILDTNETQMHEVVCDSFNLNGQKYISSGVYNQVFTNSFGCDSTIVLNLTVNQSTTANNQITICQGESYSVGGKTYTEEGFYYDTIANAIGCDSLVTTLLIVTPVDTGVTEGFATLTANATTASYQWFDCESGQIITGETNRDFSPKTNGNYGVIVTENGCSDTSACYSITNVGVNTKINNSKVVVYPNPVKEQLNIQITGELPQQLRLINALGIEVLSWVPTETEHKLNVENLAAGFYFLQVQHKTESELMKLLFIGQ